MARVYVGVRGSAGFFAHYKRVDGEFGNVVGEGY